ncbi:MAG: hypothetical protein KatS3mg016_1987 [Fimbriimonadales bacterium]|nr:MAG: hypothetical protein KatS3mg016_0512 [Fimbriimonadales bacterium]GIV06412.1 MAG: hypothetical protein KatS3mg016_1987 [Fimbriimonadales bacterium]
MRSTARPEVLHRLLAEVMQLQHRFRRAHAPLVVRLFLLPALPITWAIDTYLRLLKESYEYLLGIRSDCGGLLRAVLTRYVAWGLFAKGWDRADDAMLESIARFVRGINRVWLIGVLVWEGAFSLVIWYIVATSILRY